MNERVNGKQREVRIGWNGDEPVVDHLTGTEAKAVLRDVLRNSRELGAQLQREAQTRQTLANVVIALVHRDAARGIVGPDGKPVMPMQTVIPKESAATFREKWSFRADPTPEGTVVVVVDRIAPEIVS
jgi:hypothetical protein